MPALHRKAKAKRPITVGGRYKSGEKGPVWRFIPAGNVELSGSGGPRKRKAKSGQEVSVPTQVVELLALRETYTAIGAKGEKVQREFRVMRRGRC
jgi:hypothetical protein